jgi:hypothetical protein
LQVLLVTGLFLAGPRPNVPDHYAIALDISCIENEKSAPALHHLLVDFAEISSI